MKRIYRYFVLSFTGMAMVLFAILSVILYRQNRQSADGALCQILNQMEIRLKRGKESCEDQLKLIERDYLNRAQAIEYMVMSDEENTSVDNLQNIKKMIDVDQINIIDGNGRIVRSDNPGAVGVDLRDYPQAAEILQLSAAAGERQVFTSLGTFRADGSRASDCMAIPIEEGDYRVIQITFYTEEVNEALEEADIETAVTQFITEYRISVAALDKTGELLAVTENSPQAMDVEGAESREELLSFVRDGKNGRLCKINGNMTYLLVREYEDYYLCACFDVGDNVKSFVINISCIALLMIFTSAAVMGILRYFFHRYLFRDFERMQEDIEAFVGGDENREIRPCENKELIKLNTAVRKMREGYRHKTERLNKIVGGIQSNVAAFECLDSTNSLYVSENMAKILGIHGKRMEELTSSLDTFTEFLQKLEKRKDAENMLFYNNKWLKIDSYYVNHEYYGLVIDKTAEYLENQKTLNELHVVRRAIQRDQLTGLYGRSGFEHQMNELLHMSRKRQGIMIMLDLDNFKRINDNLGHPEGDKALLDIAECLRREFRKNDIVGRLGGDEFLVFMPDSLPRSILKQKLRGLIDALCQTLREYDKYEVTVSAGVAFLSEELPNYKALYEAADSALYVAKALGKKQYYINDEGIRCMEKTCKQCREVCPRREILGLAQKNQASV